MIISKIQIFINLIHRNELIETQIKYKELLKILSIKHFPKNMLELSQIFNDDKIDESFSPKSKPDFANNTNNNFKNSFANSSNNFNSINNKNNISSITSNNNFSYNKSQNDFFSSDENDEILRKITAGLIFKDIHFIFNPNIYENFENNIKILKQNYEHKIDSLERNMEFYKSYLENHYRRKIQKTKSNFIDNIELISDNLPIINITSEHNEKLRILRDLYEEKLKELEHVIFLDL